MGNKIFWASGSTGSNVQLNSGGNLEASGYLFDRVKLVSSKTITSSSHVVPLLKHDYDMFAALNLGLKLLEI